MNHEHTDKPCKHDLKVCTHCGDVYCSKCKKEWFKERSAWYYYPYTTGSYPTTVTYSATGNIPESDYHIHIS